MCGNGCRYSRDGECDDGGDGHVTDYCGYGTDCADCGVRPLPPHGCAMHRCGPGLNNLTTFAHTDCGSPGMPACTDRHCCEPCADRHPDCPYLGPPAAVCGRYMTLRFPSGETIIIAVERLCPHHCNRCADPFRCEVPDQDGLSFQNCSREVDVGAACAYEATSSDYVCSSTGGVAACGYDSETLEDLPQCARRQCYAVEKQRAFTSYADCYRMGSATQCVAQCASGYVPLPSANESAPLSLNCLEGGIIASDPSVARIFAGRREALPRAVRGGASPACAVQGSCELLLQAEGGHAGLFSAVHGFDAAQKVVIGACSSQLMLQNASYPHGNLTVSPDCTATYEDLVAAVVDTGVFGFFQPEWLARALLDERIVLVNGRFPGFDCSGSAPAGALLVTLPVVTRVEAVHVESSVPCAVEVQGWDGATVGTYTNGYHELPAGVALLLRRAVVTFNCTEVPGVYLVGFPHTPSQGVLEAAAVNHAWSQCLALSTALSEGNASSIMSGDVEHEVFLHANKTAGEVVSYTVQFCASAYALLQDIAGDTAEGIRTIMWEVLCVAGNGSTLSVQNVTYDTLPTGGAVPAFMNHSEETVFFRLPTAAAVPHQCTSLLFRSTAEELNAFKLAAPVQIFSSFGNMTGISHEDAGPPARLPVASEYLRTVRRFDLDLLQCAEERYVSGEDVCTAAPSRTVAVLQSDDADVVLVVKERDVLAVRLADTRTTPEQDAHSVVVVPEASLPLLQTIIADMAAFEVGAHNASSTRSALQGFVARLSHINTKRPNTTDAPYGRAAACTRQGHDVPDITVADTHAGTIRRFQYAKQLSEQLTTARRMLLALTDNEELIDHHSYVFAWNPTPGVGLGLACVHSPDSPNATYHFTSGTHAYTTTEEGAVVATAATLGVADDLTVADLNADGELDLFFRDSRNVSGRHDVVYHKRDGAYVLAGVYPFTSDCAHCTMDAVRKGYSLCDVNNDGFTDIVEGDRVLLGGNTRTVVSLAELVDDVTQLPDLQDTSSVLCMDINADGHSDIYLGGVGVPDALLINTGANATFVATRFGAWDVTLTVLAVVSPTTPQLFISKSDGSDELVNLDTFHSRPVGLLFPVYKGVHHALAGRLLRTFQTTEDGNVTTRAHIIDAGHGVTGVYYSTNATGFEVVMAEGTSFKAIPSFAGVAQTIEVAVSCASFPVGECKYRTVVADAYCGQRCVAEVHAGVCCDVNPRCKSLVNTAEHCGTLWRAGNASYCETHNDCARECCEREETHDVCEDMPHISCGNIDCATEAHLCPVTCNKCLPVPTLPANSVFIHADLASVVRSNDSGAAYLSDPAQLFVDNQIHRSLRTNTFRWDTDTTSTQRTFYASDGTLGVVFSTVENEPLYGFVIEPFATEESVPHEVSLYGLSADSDVSDPATYVWQLLSAALTGGTRRALSAKVFYVDKVHAHRQYKLTLANAGKGVAVYSVALIAKAVAKGPCADTPGWTSGELTCGAYAELYCAHNVDDYVAVQRGLGLAAVSERERNYPTDNCCACGRVSAKCARQKGGWTQQQRSTAPRTDGTAPLRALFSLEAHDADSCCAECLGLAHCELWEYDTATHICRGVAPSDTDVTPQHRAAAPQFGLPSLPVPIPDIGAHTLPPLPAIDGEVVVPGAEAYARMRSYIRSADARMVSGDRQDSFSGYPAASCTDLALRAELPLPDGIYRLQEGDTEYTAHCDMGGGGWQRFLAYNHSDDSTTTLSNGTDLRGPLSRGGSGHINLGALGSTADRLAEVRFFCQSSQSRVHFSTHSGGVLAGVRSWGEPAAKGTTAGDWRKVELLAGHNASLPAEVTAGGNSIHSPFYSSTAAYALDASEAGVWACDSDTPGDTAFEMFFKTHGPRERYNPVPLNLSLPTQDAADPHTACGGETGTVAVTGTREDHLVQLDLAKQTDWGCASFACPSVLPILQVNVSCTGAGEVAVQHFAWSDGAYGNDRVAVQCGGDSVALTLPSPQQLPAVLRAAFDGVQTGAGVVDVHVSTQCTSSAPDTTVLPTALDACHAPLANETISGSGCWHLQCPPGHYVEFDWDETDTCFYSAVAVYGRASTRWFKEGVYTGLCGDTRPSFAPALWAVSEVVLEVTHAVQNLVPWQCSGTKYVECTSDHACEQGPGGVCLVVDGAEVCGCRKGYEAVGATCKATCAVHMCGTGYVRLSASAVCPTSECDRATCCSQIVPTQPPATAAPPTESPPTPLPQTHAPTEAPQTNAPTLPPPTETPSPATPVPTALPATLSPDTLEPASVPPTEGPQTDIATPAPATDVPQTAVPTFAPGEVRSHYVLLLFHSTEGTADFESLVVGIVRGAVLQLNPQHTAEDYALEARLCWVRTAEYSLLASAETLKPVSSESSLATLQTAGAYCSRTQGGQRRAASAQDDYTLVTEVHVAFVRTAFAEVNLDTTELKEAVHAALAERSIAGGLAFSSVPSEAPTTDTPQTDAPQTAAPHTAAPHTAAPHTAAPRTNIPDTAMPTTSPTTDTSTVPETDAPSPAPTPAPTTESPIHLTRAPIRTGTVSPSEERSHFVLLRLENVSNTTGAVASVAAAVIDAVEHLNRKRRRVDFVVELTVECWLQDTQYAAFGDVFVPIAIRSSARELHLNGAHCSDPAQDSRAISGLMGDGRVVLVEARLYLVTPTYYFLNLDAAAFAAAVATALHERGITGGLAFYTSPAPKEEEGSVDSESVGRIFGHNWKRVVVISAVLLLLCAVVFYCGLRCRRGRGGGGLGTRRASKLRLTRSMSGSAVSSEGRCGVVAGVCSVDEDNNSDDEEMGASVVIQDGVGTGSSLGLSCGASASAPPLALDDVGVELGAGHVQE